MVVAGALRGTADLDEEWIDLDTGTAARFVTCPPGEKKYFLEEPGLRCSETCLPEELFMVDWMSHGLQVFDHGDATSAKSCTDLGYPLYWITTATHHVSVLPSFDTYVAELNK